MHAEMQETTENYGAASSVDMPVPLNEARVNSEGNEALRQVPDPNATML